MTGYEGWPEGPVYEGHAGVRDMLHLAWDVNEKWDSRVLEIVPLGSDRYFVRGEIRLMATSSGIRLQSPELGQIISFRDGLIVRVEQYQRADEARRAAGLES